MHVIWIHERAGHTGGAERYVHDCATRLARAGFKNTLLYDPSLPTSVEFLRSFDVALPLVDPEAQLARVDGDLIYAHRVPARAEAALAASPRPVVRMFHDHQLFCLREHKVTALGGAVCTRTVGAGCYACGGFVQRREGAVVLVGLGQLHRRQRHAFGADAFIAASSYVAGQALAHGVPADRLTTLPLYARTRCGRTTLGEGLVFVGNLVRGKGVDLLIDAVAQTRTPTFVIGDGPERERLVAQAHRLGAPVTFTGWLPETSIVSHMARARAVVMPSRVPETFGLVGVEAMAVGTPVIASLVGGVGEWLTHEVTGLAVPHDDVGALVAAIHRIMRDDVLVERLGQTAHARQNVRFTPEHHLAGLSAVLDAHVGTPTQARRGIA